MFALGHVIHTKPLSHTHTALAAGSPDVWTADMVDVFGSAHD